MIRACNKLVAGSSRLCISLDSSNRNQSIHLIMRIAPHINILQRMGHPAGKSTQSNGRNYLNYYLHLKGLKFFKGKNGHLKQKNSMLETAYLCCSICPFVIPYRNLDNLQVQLGRPENQIKIAKWVKIAKI